MIPTQTQIVKATMILIKTIVYLLFIFIYVLIIIFSNFIITINFPIVKKNSRFLAVNYFLYFLEKIIKKYIYLTIEKRLRGI